MTGNLKTFALTEEEWREYEFGPAGKRVIYRIDNPEALVLPEGKYTTHRVVDVEGIVHCVPTVGLHGCVLRWKTKNGIAAVQF